jgi:hypothetical protein
MNFIIIAPSKDKFEFWGSSILDAGYFYAPYIPLMNVPTMVFK